MMNREQPIKIDTSRIVKLLKVVVFMALAGIVSKASATATVITTTTGGSAISADTTAGTYTSLTAPVINETNAAGLETAAYTITAPTG